MVATPHVSRRYPTQPDVIEAGVAALNAAGCPVELLVGAEVAHEMAIQLPDETLRRMTLGSSRCLLLESPLEPVIGAEFDRCVADLQARGYRVLLAHPERAPGFRDDPRRLHALVAGGALCSVTAGALTGAFGDAARWFGLELLRDGLVHSVDSDAHHVSGRPPGLREGLTAAAAVLPFVSRTAKYLARENPAALLADAPLPQQSVP